MKKCYSYGERGSGRTTNQLSSLSLNGYFICHNHGSISYIKEICRRINRDDIKIIPISSISHLRGSKITDIALDHHAYDVISKEYLKEFVMIRDTYVGRS